MSVPLSSICRLKAVPTHCLVDLDKLVPKRCVEGERYKIANTILKKKNKVPGLWRPDSLSTVVTEQLHKKIKKNLNTDLTSFYKK
jgi:hypothetical protein